MSCVCNLLSWTGCTPKQTEAFLGGTCYYFSPSNISQIIFQIWCLAWSEKYPDVQGNIFYEWKSENKQMENRSMMALEQRMPVKYSGNNGAYSSAIMKIKSDWSYGFSNILRSMLEEIALIFHTYLPNPKKKFFFPL